MEGAHTSLVARALSGVLESHHCLVNRQHGIRLYRDEVSPLNINKSILLSDGNFAIILSVQHNCASPISGPSFSIDD